MSQSTLYHDETEQTLRSDTLRRQTKDKKINKYKNDRLKFDD
jgi:hypothetical protein